MGTILSFQDFGGLNVVWDMPSGPKISRWQKVSSGSSARRSSAIAQDDEADVAVFGARAGIGSEIGGEGGGEEFVARLRTEEQFFVSGQAGSMGQQHAQRHVATTRVGGRETRE